MSPWLGAETEEQINTISPHMPRAYPHIFQAIHLTPFDNRLARQLKMFSSSAARITPIYDILLDLRCMTKG